MKQPSLSLKIAALSTFLLLLSGLVAYKSGLLDGLFGIEPNPVNQPSVAGEVQSLPVDGVIMATDTPKKKKKKKKKADDMDVFPSSKSAPVYVPPEADEPEKGKETIMPSSKFDQIIDTPAQENEAGDDLLPSYKSGAIFKPNQAGEQGKPKKKKREIMPSSKSGAVFESEEKPIIQADTYRRSLPSTKSGRVFEPAPKKDLPNQAPQRQQTQTQDPK